MRDARETCASLSIVLYLCVYVRSGLLQEGLLCRERLIAAIQGGGFHFSKSQPRKPPHATFKSEWGKCKPQELLLTRYSRFLE